MPKISSKTTKVKSAKPVPSTQERGYNLETSGYLDKIEKNIQSNQSKLSLILGALIVLVVGILVFNFFNKSKPSLGPSQQTEQNTQTEDVSLENLPGKYTVKEGDTLFLIAEKYYGDGFKYEEIAKASNIEDINSIEVGQVLEIPKLETTASPTSTPSAEPSPTETPKPSEQPSPTTQQEATSGPTDTEWGPAISGSTYTIVEGDWLSTIAARAYGDIMAYQKLAQANNIPNPDYILPGTILTIPR